MISTDTHLLPLTLKTCMTVTGTFMIYKSLLFKVNGKNIHDFDFDLTLLYRICFPLSVSMFDDKKIFGTDFPIKTILGNFSHGRHPLLPRVYSTSMTPGQILRVFVIERICIIFSFNSD